MSRSTVTQDPEEEEDDYMSMTFADPTPVHETSLQRANRKRKEGLLKGINKTKEQLKLEESQAREAALSTEISSKNRGFKMLSKLGYVPGTSLGKPGGAGTVEPIKVQIKEDRSGIGVESEKKRKAKEALESASKKAKETELDYRDRMAEERNEKRREGQVFAAQKIAEKLDTERDEEEGRPAKAGGRSERPVEDFAKDRVIKESVERMKRDLLARGATILGVNDEEDDDDRLALGKEKEEILVEELEEEDEELDEFNSLGSEERLEKLVKYLREQYWYCVWCKFQYEEPEMDGCPGLTEDDHD